MMVLAWMHFWLSWPPYLNFQFKGGRDRGIVSIYLIFQIHSGTIYVKTYTVKGYFEDFSMHFKGIIGIFPSIFFFFLILNGPIRTPHIPLPHWLTCPPLSISACFSLSLSLSRSLSLSSSPFFLSSSPRSRTSPKPPLLVTIWRHHRHV